ncbi:hypothetical protein BCR39DRAFT_549124 [Naematelia encephala]|uniref:Uncharacterized protein n=1 Tax=Naematelia encephala TaxID=71784 RepID=A0A1Y2AMU9_9TREE|nr:hypothetical protein BCR39DRAFT_549124 [Naematelia encephala]
MGYTIILQWTLPPSPTRQLNLSEIISTRILTHYSLSSPTRSTVQFRTYRTSSLELTTIMYSPPLPAVRDLVIQGVRDDTAYLFLEARHTSTASQENGQSEKQEDKIKAKTEVIEDDGFEIIDPPPPLSLSSTKTSTAVGGGTPVGDSGDNNASSSKPGVSGPGAKKARYRIMAVRPAVSTVPMLQNLLSPLVLGLTKAARAAATTTGSSLPTPTPIPGTSHLLTSLTYPPLPTPLPTIRLTVHILPTTSSSSPQSIILEGEFVRDTALPHSRHSYQETILRECLEGCIPVGTGEIRWFTWDAKNDKDDENKHDDDEKSWQGIERTRRASYLLAKCLKESSII